MNETERNILTSTLKTMVERKQLRPSTSQYASRILFVKKADGSLRLCVDYRALNAITIRNRCPIPYIADLRSQIRGKGYLTKCDLRDGYYNGRMKDSDIEKKAFGEEPFLEHQAFVDAGAADNGSHNGDALP